MKQTAIFAGVVLVLSVVTLGHRQVTATQKVAAASSFSEELALGDWASIAMGTNGTWQIRVMKPIAGQTFEEHLDAAREDREALSAAQAKLNQLNRTRNVVVPDVDITVPPADVDVKVEAREPKPKPDRAEIETLSQLVRKLNAANAKNYPLGTTSLFEIIAAGDDYVKLRSTNGETTSIPYTYVNRVTTIPMPQAK